MNKIWLIIKREYLTRVKKKSFIIMTFVGPLLIAALSIGGAFVASQDTMEYDVLVSDPDGLISGVNKETNELECKYPRRFQDSKNIHYTFTREVWDYDKLKEGPYNISLEIDKDLVDGLQARLLFKNPPSVMAKEKIKRQLDKSFEEKRVIENLNIDYEEYQGVKVGFQLIELDINKVGETKSIEIVGAVGFVFSLVIYVFILMYGVMVMRGVIEEKTNRIVEVIVSSVKPYQLMMGKIIGIGAVGITQFLMWTVMISLFTTLGIPLIASRLMEAPAEIIEQGEMVQVQGNTNEVLENMMMIYDIAADVPWGMLVVVLLAAFIGGFLLYGSIFAAIGSAVDSETETQQFMIPITVPLVLGYIISIMMIFNPSGSVGFWGSFIPLTSPTVLLVRTAIEGPTIWWQVLISLLILFGTAIAIVWLAGKIYRTGILMYGKKASFKELIKWLRYNG